MITVACKDTPLRKEKDTPRSMPIDPLAPAPSTPPIACVDPDERTRRIAEAAYYRAERRAFCPGCELEDWLEAEKATDEELQLMVSGGNAVGIAGGG